MLPRYVKKWRKTYTEGSDLELISQGTQIPTVTLDLDRKGPYTSGVQTCGGILKDINSPGIFTKTNQSKDALFPTRTSKQNDTVWTPKKRNAR